MIHESELKYGDIFGEIAIKFGSGMNLNGFCSRHIPEYNLERFDAFAMRVFLGSETVITIYAKDNMREESAPADESIPVKKFKLNSVPLQELLAICESINFTVATDKEMIGKMEVINR